MQNLYVVSKLAYVVDIGNSLIKTAVFKNDTIEQVNKYNGLQEALNGRHGIERVIVSSVTVSSDEIRKHLKIPFLYLDHSVPLPIRLDYQTPETLGIDRIAGAVGAWFLNPGNASLIVDLGSCNTYDLVDGNGVFRGGMITPGYQMRLKSMSQYTGRLPDLTGEWINTLSPTGKSTREAMLKGAFEGILFEIENYFNRYGKDFANLNILLTGGNAPYFESKIKAPIFASPDLVLIGLYRILVHNEEA